MKKRYLLTGMLVLMLTCGCSGGSDESQTTETTTETTTKAITTTEETTTETTASIAESVIAQDKLVSLYFENVEYINTAPYEVTKNILMNFTDMNSNYKIDITEPTEAQLGTLKVSNIANPDNNVYFCFYPNNSNAETLYEVAYSLNSEVSIEASNDMNFYMQEVTYSTRNTNRQEVKQKVSNTDEQLEFLAALQ